MKEKTKFISNINFAIELKKCQPQSYEVHFSLIASNIKISMSFTSLMKMEWIKQKFVNLNLSK